MAIRDDPSCATRGEDQPARKEGPVPPLVPGRVTVVGVSAAGKSTLVRGLLRAGYDARHCAQEHSYVPDMWRRLSRPEFLVYVDASLQVVRRRRSFAQGQPRLREERRRLAHARRHGHIYVHTDALTAVEVLERVLDALAHLGAPRADPTHP